MSYLQAEPAPRRRSVGRIIGISVFAVVAAVVVVALVAAGFAVWTIQRSFPQLDGEVALAGLDDAVTVQRDELGVPTITAGTAHDLFFAQGYVHAQDRFWEMDFRRHVTAGRLSELFGESQVATDTFLRTLGWRDIAEQELELLTDGTRSAYEAYAAGVNAYLADHDGAAVSLEHAILGFQNPDYVIEEWSPIDSIAWLKAMAWDLRHNLLEETERALLAPHYTAEEISQLFPGYPYDRNPVIVPRISADAPGPAIEAAPASVEWVEAGSVIEAVGELVGGAGEGLGSNAWVVSGQLTESGMPLLANDPHLSASLPGVWYQGGLRCAVKSDACPFDVSGFGFSGVPGVVIGHNDRIAWGITNLTTDVADLYVERIQGDEYWRDGVLMPLEVRTETIEVAGGDDIQIEVRSTAHGPLISDHSKEHGVIAADPFVGSAGVPVPAGDGFDGEYAVSLAWTALRPGTTAESILAIDVAQDFPQFRAAAALFDVPAQNLVYADVDGNIGYQAPGELPIRGIGDGSLPQPGWDSAYDWRGFIPFEELPVAYNPDEGFIVAANNAVVDESYGHFLTYEWDYGWRAARIVHLIQRTAAAGRLTVDDMRRIQADTEFWMGRRLMAEYAGVEVAGAGPQHALDLLMQWDAQSDADSAAAAYANVLWDELVANLFVRGREHPAPVRGQHRVFLVVDRLLEDAESPWWTNDELGVHGRDEMLARSAEDAYDRLVRLQGDDPDRWNWGSLHALNLRSGTFGSSGIAPLEWLFNRGPYPTGGGSSVVDATGWELGSGSFATVTVPSMRMVVDLADFDASGWTDLTGVSGHPFHPHYADQTELWRTVQLSNWAYTPDAVDAAAAHTLTLTPGG